MSRRAVRRARWTLLGARFQGLQWAGQHRPRAQLIDRRVVRGAPSCAGTARCAGADRRRPACSAAASGTTRLAASVGVAARRSATRSQSGLSGSCPTALITGVVQVAMARHRVSSENGSRSSTLPPPRATMMTSTPPSASRSPAPPRSGRPHWVPARRCCAPRTAPRASGRRRSRSTSCSAADARPVMRPMVLGRNGIGRLSRAVEQALGFAAAGAAVRCGPAARPMPDGADIADPQREAAARRCRTAVCRTRSPGRPRRVSPAR